MVLTSMLLDRPFRYPSTRTTSAFDPPCDCIQRTQQPSFIAAEAYLSVAFTETHSAVWQPAKMSVSIDQRPNHVLDGSGVNHSQEGNLRSERIPETDMVQS